MASDWQVVSPTDNSWQEVKPQQPATPASSAMEKTGIYNVPVLGGVMRSLISPETGFIDTVAQKAQSIQQQAQTDPKAAGKMAQQAGATSGNPILDLIQNKGFSRAAVPSALTLSSVADLPELATGAIGAVKNIPKAASYLSKGGLVKGLTKAYDAATQAGTKISVNDILTEAKSGIKSNTLKKAIDDFLNKNYISSEFKQITPNKFVSKSTTDFTPNEAWQISKEISKNYGPSIFDHFTGVTQEKQATQAVRNAIANLLKDAAPTAKGLSKAYSVYSKLGGSPAEWAGRTAIGVGTGKLLKKAGIPENAAMDAIMTLLAGKVI